MLIIASVTYINLSLELSFTNCSFPQFNEQIVEDQPYQPEEVYHYQLPFHQQQQQQQQKQQNDEEVNPETEQHIDPLEQARIKKLDFFRALGQATLDEIDSAPTLTTNHFDKSILFTSHIVNASDYNRQVSAPNVTPPRDVTTLTSNVASRQMSVPASWREDPLARKRSQSTEKGNNDVTRGYYPEITSQEDFNFTC